MNLDPSEMAFRKIYQDLLWARQITTIFRPGDRSPGKRRSYTPGQKITIRLIEKVGADWAMIAPEFDPNFQMLVVIETVEVFRLGELEARHFEGSSLDVQDIQSLRFHLGTIYNLAPDELNDSSFVTRTTFTFK
jgi:hypothetical protein